MQAQTQWTIKTPYYPEKSLSQWRTPLGLLEVTEPNLYEVPIPGKVIMRVDLLESLRDILGDNCMRCRSYVYSLISGNCGDNFNEVLISFYKRYSKVRQYLDEKILFAENETATTAVMKPLLDIIESRREEIEEIVKNSGGKYLFESHGYIYASYRHSDLPDLGRCMIMIGGIA